MTRLDTYADLLSWLFVARRAGIDFDLSRVRNCLRRLGDPQDGFAVRVHIAGTNGKGSTAAFIEALVRRAGRTTGVFTSPHLSRFSERFAINGVPADEVDILAAGRALSDAMVDGEPLTFFERATVIAVLVFARAKIDVCILEVGLGGRLDATNVIAAEIGVVTTIAKDHAAFLGDQLDGIAREKAGIFKPGQRVVLSTANRDDIIDVLQTAAEGTGAHSVTRAPATDLALAMVGDHQRYNAGCALAVADQLQQIGIIELDAQARAAAVGSARMPGRFEIVAEAPTIIVDGAHNPNAAQALVNAVDERYPGRRVFAVVAVSDGKDAAGIVAPIAQRATAVVATRYGQPRSMSPESVSSLIGAVTKVVVEPGIEQAVARARSLATDDGVIIVAGSLFLVGEARQLLLDAPADPQVVQDPM